MNFKCQKISENLSINKVVLDKKTDDNVVPGGKNVIFAIDVSGSMYSELPKIRTQLKNKIPDLISMNDTISIIWFSGSREAGVLKEGVQVKNLVDLQKLNDAIDRFLVPIGCTAFLPPIKLAKDIISNLSSNGNYFSFIFLSDGYNNDSSWKDVISELTTLEPLVGNATFIEYGYYADSDALTEMSEVAGGEKIFAKDFDSYDEDFSKIVTRGGAPKISVDISEFKAKSLFPFIFTINKDNELISVYTTNDKTEVLIPEDSDSYYFLTKKPVSTEIDELNSTEILSAAYILSERLKYNYVEEILVMLGDVNLINQFSGAYGKQKLNDLRDKIKELAFHNDELFKGGQVKDYKIDPNQYCFMDLIKDLQDGDNYFYPYNKSFNYNRIGTKKVTKIELSDEKKEALAKAKTLNEIAEITKDLSAPEFVYPDNAGEIGMSFNTLVWNQDRANLSVQTRLDGMVKLPTNEFNLTEIKSFIYRNYTLVKDGVLNVSEIPVKLDKTTYNKLSKKGLLTPTDTEDMYLLDISNLPTINRSMVTNISAKFLGNAEYNLIRLQAIQKYLKYLREEYINNLPTDELCGQASKYSPEVIDWLKSIGITETGGFNPKVEAVKSEDFYVAPVLKTKIESLSSIPKISDFVKKADSGKKLNVIETILANIAYEVSEAIGEKPDYIQIDEYMKKVDTNRQIFLTEISKVKFGIILSRSWFKEFESLSENVLSFKFDDWDNELKVTFDYKESQIKL